MAIKYSVRMISYLLPSSAEAYDSEIDYWTKKLEGLAPLRFPGLKDEGTSHHAAEACYRFTVDNETTAQLLQLAQRRETTILMTLLAAFKLLLFRHTQQEDIWVATIRNRSPKSDCDGPFSSQANPVILRSQVFGDMSFDELLDQVKLTTAEGFAYSQVPFAELMQALGMLQERTGSALSSTKLLLLNCADAPAMDLGVLDQFGPWPFAPDLALIITQRAWGMACTLRYRAQGYELKQIERMADHYLELLKSVIADPGRPVGELPMLNQEERHQLLYAFNDTLTDYSRQSTLVDLFEQQVTRTPHHLALVLGSDRMTYSQLNERSNRLARYLVNAGLNPGDCMGILLTRGFDMITAMYAILKAGGAYVPIDPEYPVDRQAYIANQSSVKLIVCDEEYSPLAQLLGANRMLNITNLPLDAYSPANLATVIDSTQLAYTIYTSGSTGRPKGVMIEHHSAVNLIQWVNTTFQVGTHDRLLFITSMCFDLSVYDIFGILSTGGSLVIAKQNQLQDVKQLQDMLQEHAITFWDSVPTTMDYLIRELETSNRPFVHQALKTVFMSGDWIAVDLPERIKKYFPNANIISLGGATEATVWSNFFPVTQTLHTWNSIPYGKPIQNNFFYLLNEQLQPVPQGAVGELFIGGVGVALNTPTTSKKQISLFCATPLTIGQAQECTALVTWEGCCPI